MAPMPLAWNCHAWSQDRTGLTVARLPSQCIAPPSLPFAPSCLACASIRNGGMRSAHPRAGRAGPRCPQFPMPSACPIRWAPGGVPGACGAVLGQRARVGVEVPVAVAAPPPPPAAGGARAVVVARRGGRAGDFPRPRSAALCPSHAAGRQRHAAAGNAGSSILRPRGLLGGGGGGGGVTAAPAPPQKPQGPPPRPPPPPPPQALLAPPAPRSKPGASRHVTRIQMDATGRCISDDAAWPLDGCTPCPRSAPASSGRGGAP